MNSFLIPCTCTYQHWYTKLKWMCVLEIGQNDNTYMYILYTFVGTCIYDTINAKGWLILLTKISCTLRVFWSVHLNTVSAIKIHCCLYHRHLCSSAKLINSIPKFTHVCTCTCNYMYMYMHMYMIDPTHYTKDIRTSLSTDAHAHTCIMYTITPSKVPLICYKALKILFLFTVLLTCTTHIHCILLATAKIFHCPSDPSLFANAVKGTR